MVSVVEDRVTLVDPWIASNTGRFDYFQSACMPFGMVKLRPDSSTSEPTNGNIWAAGYRRCEPQVRGLSHLHDFGISGLQLMPFCGQTPSLVDGDDGWASEVQHDDESVEPGFHALVLDRYNICVELTATERVGIHRYTYRESGPAGIIVNLGGDAHDLFGSSVMFGAQVEWHSATRLVGHYVQSGILSNGFYYGRDNGHRVRTYFDIEFDREIATLNTFDQAGETGVLSAGGTVDLRRGGVVVHFGHLAPGEEVNVKVAVSFTGVDGARRNQLSEAPGWAFDERRHAARDTWNGLFDRIQISGGTVEQRVKFYTDLFHVLAGRSMVSDADGAYLDDCWGSPRVRQVEMANGKPQHHMFTMDALWITQWNLNTILGLAYPDVYVDMVRNVLQYYRDSGLLPRGTTGGRDSFVMTGSPVTQFIVGAYNKNFGGFDVDEAFDAMLDAHSIGGLFDKATYEWHTWGTTPAGRWYIDRGYIPCDLDTTYLSRGAGETLEFANQDWTLATLAESLDRKGINVAQFAQVAVSSQLDDSEFAGEHAVDGRPARSAHDGTGVEWRSRHETTPWIELTWRSPQTLRRVVLRDRLDAEVSVQSGVLSFSDGTRLPVDNIPTDGSPRLVDFAPRSVTSVRFTATGGTGTCVGLSEFEAWDSRDVAAYLRRRSENWRNLFDPATKYIRPRSSSGEWCDPFDELNDTSDFVEANAWQATWFVTHDVAGLANALGGRDVFADRLSRGFEASVDTDFSDARVMGDLGAGAFLNYSNQPSLEAAHLFNYVGFPWLTQYWVREVQRRAYGRTDPNGGYALGDEDQGQMGSISALMAIGLFEVTGGGLRDPVYDITSPIFDEVKISPPGGTGSFVVRTHVGAGGDTYIQRAALNDEELKRCWITHRDVERGGMLELWLGPHPNRCWGVDSLPPSESSLRRVTSEATVADGEAGTLLTETSESGRWAESVVTKGAYEIGEGGLGVEDERASRSSEGVFIDGPSVIADVGSMCQFVCRSPSGTGIEDVVWSAQTVEGADPLARILSNGLLQPCRSKGVVEIRATTAYSGAATKLVTLAGDAQATRVDAARLPDVTSLCSSVLDSEHQAWRAVDGVVDDPEDAWVSAPNDEKPWFELRWRRPVSTDSVQIQGCAGAESGVAHVELSNQGIVTAASDVPLGSEQVSAAFAEVPCTRLRIGLELGRTADIGSNLGLSQVTVRARPQANAPRNTRLDILRDGLSRFSWSPPADCGLAVVGYELSCSSPTGVRHVHRVDSTASQVVEDIVEGTSVSVRALYADRRGPSSDALRRTV